MSFREHEFESIVKWAGIDYASLELGKTVTVNWSQLKAAIHYGYDIGFSDANSGEAPPQIPEGSTRCAPQNFKA